MAKKGLMKEFKEFAIKGNMFDLAVGVIIGGAFQSLVKALTDKVLMPVISIFTGGLNFEEWKIPLPHLFGELPVDEAGNEIVNYLMLGDFISGLLNFLIMAFVVFLMVKGINRLRDAGKKKEPEAPKAPPEPTTEEKLLTEIRDLLREQK